MNDTGIELTYKINFNTDEKRIEFICVQSGTLGYVTDEFYHDMSFDNMAKLWNERAEQEREAVNASRAN